MSDETDVGTADTMRGRANESRLKLWVLLHANRLLVTAVLTALLFLAFAIVGAVLSPPFAEQVSSGAPLEALFSTMILVVVTGTTFVVTIGQLVLTQEDGPLGDQHERMSETMNVRGYAADLTGSPTPADPADLLGEIVRETAERSEALRASVDESDDEALREEVDESDDEALREEVDALADSVVGNAATVREQLAGAQFGSFDVLGAALNFNYSWKIHQVERVASEYEASLDESQLDRLYELKTALSMYGPVREHVKTLYFQWALIELSQRILYTAVPTLAVAGLLVGVVDAGTFPGSTLGVDHLLLVVAAAFAVALVPFLLFVAYLLRILTVAKRTLAIGPLILRDSQQ